jgi:hypothetical protein
MSVPGNADLIVAQNVQRTATTSAFAGKRRTAPILLSNKHSEIIFY